MTARPPPPPASRPEGPNGEGEDLFPLEDPPPVAVPLESSNGTGTTADSTAGHHGQREGAPAVVGSLPASPTAPMPPLVCRDCPLWYGEEDRGWGPCSIKHQRGDVRFITFGGHSCDEGYQPPVAVREGKAARLRGVRSTSSASAVGYSSTSKQGKGRVRATRRSKVGSTSTRRRASSRK